MKNSLVQQVRRVDVIEMPAAGGGFDYADSFEIQMPEADSQPPATWVRAGMTDSPALVEWIADRLGMGDGSAQTTNQIEGGRVIESNADVVQIEWSLPLMRVVVLGRRIDPTGRRLTSFLYYRRPRLARVVWAIVGIGHRRMARRLLAIHVLDKADSPHHPQRAA